MLNDLWIGDTIRVKTNNQYGIFKGVDNSGKAIVDINGTLILITEQDLELIEIEEESNAILELNVDNTETTKKIKSSKFHTTLDMHFEVMQHRYPYSGGHILEYQLQSCKDFYAELLKSNYKYAKIIHGKGEGILKDHITILLRNEPAIAIIQESLDGGSIDIFLK